MTDAYGLPAGTSISYNQLGFPAWVDALCRQWGIDSSTYPGHQEGDRRDIGAAPNPQRLNRGIDWAGDPDTLLRFAKWLVSVGPPRTSGVYGPPGVEMIIYQHPRTGERVWYPSFVNYGGDFGGHTDHVHLRVSEALIDTSAPPELSRTDRYALAVITEGRSRGISRKGICIALTVPFVESGWQMYANSNVPESLNYPHDAVGFDHDSTGLFQQRQAWGPLSCTMDAYCSAGLFYDGGKAGQRGLTDFPYDTDDRTPGGWAQAVQVSAFPDRYQQHWGAANELYDRLVGITAPPPSTGGFLMALSDQEQREVLQASRALLAPQRSRSALRGLGQGTVGDAADQVWDIDGSVHVMYCYLRARLGDPVELALLQEVAAADLSKFPDRANDAALAQAMLADLSTAPAVEPPLLPPAPSPQPDTSRELSAAYAEIARLRDENSRLSAPSTALAVVETNGNGAKSLGDVVKTVVDAVEELKLSDALSNQDYSTLEASIKILQMKNGSPA